MDNNISQNIEPRKRKIWVSVLLTLMVGPGITAIYCGNLRLGIFIEILLTTIYIIYRNIGLCNGIMVFRIISFNRRNYHYIRFVF